MQGRNPKSPVTVNYIMPFGKHKGLSLKTLLDIDPGYIVWLKDENVLNIPVEIYNKAVDEDWEDDNFDFGHNYSSYYDD
jgi:hypothetical protein